MGLPILHMYCCNGVVVAVNATMTNDHYANSKPNSILIRKIKYYSVTVTSSQSQHANVILQCQLLSHCDILYTDFINNSLLSVSSVIRHLRAVRICAAALLLLDRCRTWQSGIALWEKEILGRQAVNK